VSYFSDTLSAAVAQTGLSLNEVARRLPMDAPYLSRLCRAQLNPSSTALGLLYQQMNPEKFETLAADWGTELIFAHLKDVAGDAGLSGDSLHLGILNKSDVWAAFPDVLKDRLITLGQASLGDELFASVLADLEPLALKFLGALADSKELSRLKRAKIYPFPEATEHKVAEDITSEAKKKAPGTRGAAAAIPPPGDSQQPSA